MADVAFVTMYMYYITGSVFFVIAAIYLTRRPK